jgi:hypothetical protein
MVEEDERADAAASGGGERAQDGLAFYVLDARNYGQHGGYSKTWYE